MNTCYLLFRAMARSTIIIGILIIEESTQFKIAIKVMESRPVGESNCDKDRTSLCTPNTSIVGQ